MFFLFLCIFAKIPSYNYKYLTGGILLNKTISIITDPDGQKLVLINDVKFKSRRSLNWTTIEEILKEYIGTFFEIQETAERVYIGSDFPDEFCHSLDTKSLKGANEKANANLASDYPSTMKMAS